MASEWKEKGGGDDFDDEGLPLLRKHTQVRPNTRSADSVYSLQTAFLVRPRRNDAGVGATPSLSPRPEPARTSPKYRHSIDARYSIGSGDEPRARARVRPAHPAQPRRTNVERPRGRELAQLASWRQKHLLNFVFQPPTFERVESSVADLPTSSTPFSQGSRDGQQSHEELARRPDGRREESRRTRRMALAGESVTLILSSHQIDSTPTLTHSRPVRTLTILTNSVHPISETVQRPRVQAAEERPRRRRPTHGRRDRLERRRRRPAPVAIGRLLGI
jgi:hypothetical protein